MKDGPGPEPGRLVASAKAMAQAAAMAKTVAVDAVFARCVPQLSFADGKPPRYLWVSSRPGRLNPRGVACLYLSASEATASAEYAAAWKGTSGARQPKLTFHARVRVARALDLGDAATLAALKLTEGELSAPWRLASAPTRLQELGAFLAKSRAAAAVLYPSVAAKEPGFNIAVYLDALQPPDSIEVLGRDGQPIETWCQALEVGKSAR